MTHPDHDDKVHWGYEGSAGPDYWADFCPDCGGRRQSPVDIEVAAAVETDFPGPVLDWAPVTSFRVINNGHTLMVPYTYELSPEAPAAGNAVSTGGVTYQCQQFHFHTPSEHTVNGQPYDLEMHMVHARPAGPGEAILVVGLFMQAGRANEEFQKILDHTPRVESDWAAAATLNPLSWVGAGGKWFRYPGSLTTPPCTENVSWYLYSRPVEISAQQIQQFGYIFRMNARPVQALNGRTIEVSRDTF